RTPVAPQSGSTRPRSPGGRCPPSSRRAVRPCGMLVGVRATAPSSPSRDEPATGFRRAPGFSADPPRVETGGPVGRPPPSQQDPAVRGPAYGDRVANRDEEIAVLSSGL